MIYIVTHYYHSTNYGGLLQAYALQRFCDRLQPARQLQVDVYALLLAKIQNKQDVPRSLYQKIRAFYLKWKSRYEAWYFRRRRTLFQAFESAIPHADYASVENSYSDQDIFITGSDQVWNSDWWDDLFFLSFASHAKAKIAYAASCGVAELSPQQITYMQQRLADFKGISVREAEIQAILQAHLTQDVKFVVDPTMLFTGNDWRSIAHSPKIRGKYIFAYFLGNTGAQQRAARLIADKLHLKLVIVPYLGLHFLHEKTNYADVCCNDVGPREWLGLIQNAEYVLTDSFHGTVFSLLFHKKFQTFLRKPREGEKDMNSRLVCLLEAFHERKRLQLDPDVLDMETLCAPLNEEELEKTLLSLRQDSASWLTEMIENDNACRS